MIISIETPSIPAPLFATWLNAYFLKKVKNPNYYFAVNGLGAPGVLPPFALGIGTPLAGGYSSGLPNLGAFALANSGALQTATPALRGFSNVLLVSNLNEEVNIDRHSNATKYSIKF